jgi:hypothetical protein
VTAFYTLLLGDVTGPRVSFVQDGEILTATWMTSAGKTYGVGTYRWDADSGSFTGTSTTRFMCFAEAENGTTTTFTFQHLVREQLYVVNDRELRDRWTKPIDVDCSVGLVEKFKWSEMTWIATDKDWKPLLLPSPLRDIPPPRAPDPEAPAARSAK